MNEKCIIFIIVIFSISCTSITANNDEIYTSSYVSFESDLKCITVCNISEYPIDIRRSFLGVFKEIVVLEPNCKYIDKDVYPGTAYEYIIYDMSGNKIDSERCVSLINKVRVGWNKLSGSSPWFKIKNVNIKNAEIKIQYMHGVKLVIAYNEDILDGLTETLKANFEKQCYSIFNRLYLIFGDFPLNEYRIIVTNKYKKPIEEIPGCTVKIKLVYDYRNQIFQNDELAHQIAHAWISGKLNEELKEKWIIEGFTQFMGYAVLDNSYDLYNSSLKSKKYVKHASEPLYGMATKYFRTEDAISYYSKGMLFFGTVLSEIKNKNIDCRLFFKEMYDEYLMECYNTRNKKITSKKFRNSLEEWFGFDVSRIYDPYVYGNEVLDASRSSSIMNEIRKLYEMP